MIGNVPYFAISDARTGDIKLQKSIPIADGSDPAEDGNRMNTNHLRSQPILISHIDLNR